jgi:hypothetical protein
MRTKPIWRLEIIQSSASNKRALTQKILTGITIWKCGCIHSLEDSRISTSEAQEGHPVIQRRVLSLISSDVLRSWSLSSQIRFLVGLQLNLRRETTSRLTFPWYALRRLFQSCLCQSTHSLSIWAWWRKNNLQGKKARLSSSGECFHWEIYIRINLRLKRNKITGGVVLSHARTEN